MLLGRRLQSRTARGGGKCCLGRGRPGLLRVLHGVLAYGRAVVCLLAPFAACECGGSALQGSGLEPRDTRVRPERTAEQQGV